jgi:2-polyprenyl-3-methyl-5-hydroxy-6-metoxy-1,4-benzoquinol methylase
MATDTTRQDALADAVQWDREAIAVDSATLADLASFFGMDGSACQSRLNEYRMGEMAEEWHRVDPETPSEMRKFYEDTELYIWELAKWHASDAYNPYRDRISLAMRLFPPTTHPRVLDFGAGIATASLAFARAGYDLTIADVPGKTLAFAKHRFRRLGLGCSVIEVVKDLPDLPAGFDVLICFDVLEHVPDAEKMLKRLVRSLRVGGVALIVTSFADEGDHPQHLACNIERFKRMAWDWALVGAGLRFHPSGLLVKVSARHAVPRKVRWLLHSKFPRLPWELLYGHGRLAAALMRAQRLARRR